MPTAAAEPSNRHIMSSTWRRVWKGMGGRWKAMEGRCRTVEDRKKGVEGRQKAGGRSVEGR